MDLLQRVFNRVLGSEFAESMLLTLEKTEIRHQSAEKARKQQFRGRFRLGHVSEFASAGFSWISSSKASEFFEIFRFQHRICAYHVFTLKNSKNVSKMTKKLKNSVFATGSNPNSQKKLEFHQKFSVWSSELGLDTKIISFSIFANIKNEWQAQDCVNTTIPDH